VSWQGLGKYVGIKQKRRRLLGDECFPAGTLVDTPSGPRKIETLKAGELVLSATGVNRIRDTMCNPAESLVKITALDGRTVICTPNHTFLTQKGWIKAAQLDRSCYLLSPHDSLQVLRNPNKEQNLLQSSMQYEMANTISRRESVNLLKGGFDKKRRSQQTNVHRQARVSGASSTETVDKQLYEESRDAGKSPSNAEANGPQAKNTLWKRNWTNSGREDFVGTIPRRTKQLSSKNTKETMVWMAPVLQGGYCVSRHKTSCGSGRRFSPQDFKTRAGREENKHANGSWVDSVEIYEQEGSGRHAEREGRITVYNLEIEGHPSYSVNGFVVHNCQVMKSGYLDALANLNSGNQEGYEFKGVFVGNPLGVGDPLDRIAEPKNGWGTEGEIKKTTVWDNRFENGRTINLVGTDSPNGDYPQDEPVKFPWMINSRSIESVSNFYGKDSLQYWSQCLGIRKAGLNGRRVFTRNLAVKFKAMEEVAWKNDSQIRIYAVDAAYGEVGGDRCVGGWGSFGRDVNGDMILHMNPHVIIPVKAGTDTSAEDQIAEFVRQDCISLKIPAENVYYDATGRGSLGTAFARIWSPFVNPVEFGGRATNRQVSAELMIVDPETQKMRPKTCYEHFSKFVTELWFMARYVIESGQMRGLTEEVLEDGSTREWKMVTGNRIEIEAKIDTKERMGRSPDLMDWWVTVVEGARQKGFQLRALAAPQKKGNDDWKDTLRKKAMDLHHAGALNYSA